MTWGRPGRHTADRSVEEYWKLNNTAHGATKAERDQRQAGADLRALE